MRSLASSAQKSIGYSTTSVTSRHFETPSPLGTLCHKNLNPSPYGAWSLLWTNSISHQISIQEVAPENCFSASQLLATLFERLPTSGIRRGEQLIPLEIRTSATAFFANRTKRDGRTQEDLAYIRLMLELKWKMKGAKCSSARKGSYKRSKKPLTTVCREEGAHLQAWECCCTASLLH